MSSGGLAIWDEPLYCENVCRPEDIIMPPCREDEDKEALILRKERIEEIGRRYLDGHCPIILTASLRGPFTQKSGWSNPWKSETIDKEEAVPESSYEESDYEVEETCMGQVESQLAQKSQQYTQQDKGLSQITDFSDQLQPSKPLLALEDERFLSSNTNAIIRGEKRSIGADWLKGTTRSKKPRWETPDRGSPTPMAVPTSQRKQKSTNTKTPPSKTSNATSLVNGSFNYVRVAAMNTRGGKETKKESANPKRRHSEKNEGASDTTELARGTAILPQTAFINHRRAASAQSAPQPSNISQLSSKAMPLRNSQSTPRTRIPDLQEEFAARIGGSGLAKNFKDHWADLFAKQNLSSPVRSSGQGPSNIEAIPTSGQTTEVEDDSDEHFETPQDMEVEPVAPDTHQSESFSKSDCRPHQGEQDNARHDNPPVLEDISMADTYIKQTSQEGEAMHVNTPETHTKHLEVETTVMDPQEQTATQMSIEADETIEPENRPDHSVDQLNITNLEMATPIQARRFRTQDSQPSKLMRSAKRRRSRQQSREAKALVNEPSVDRTKSLEAGSATTTLKSRSQRTSSPAVEVAPEILPSALRSIHEAGTVGKTNQNTQEPDHSLLQDDNELIKDPPDAQLVLKCDAIDNKYVPDVLSQNLSTPAQSPNYPALERQAFISQSTPHRTQVGMGNSQERGSQAIVQPAFLTSTPLRKDTPDATTPDDGLAISALKRSSQRYTRSTSKSTQDRRASLKQSQEITINSQNINASQQSSWHKGSKKSTPRRWQPSMDAEASSDEDMEDIPAKRPSSRPLAENINNPGKQIPGGDSTQTHAVPSQTQSQNSRRKSVSRAWQPPSDAVPSSGDDIGDIPARTPSQSSPNKSQRSARVLRSAQISSQSSIKTAQNPASSANGVHMSTTASSTAGTPSPRRSIHTQATPNASIPPPCTQSPWAPTANLENLFVSVSALVDNDLSHSLSEAKQILPEQDKDRHSTPEENFIRPISAFITPSPKKPPQTTVPKAPFDPLLNPWVSTNPSESKPSTKSGKRVSFVVTDSPSTNITKDRLCSPPPAQKIEVEDIRGVGEKISLYQARKNNQTRTSFESKNSQGSQAPVWAYSEAFRAADQLVGAEVEPLAKDTNGGLLGVDIKGGAEREGGFDMQKFLMEGEVLGLDMPQEEYWDAEMYAGGRDLGEGIW